MDVIHSPKFKLYLINNKEEIVSISSFIHPFIYLFIYQTVFKKRTLLRSEMLETILNILHID